MWYLTVPRICWQHIRRHSSEHEPILLIYKFRRKILPEEAYMEVPCIIRFALTKSLSWSLNYGTVEQLKLL